MTLSKAQIKFLKKESHALKSIYQMGKLGITDNFIEQLDMAIERHEMIKFNILQNSSEAIKEAATEIAQALDAQIIQTIGHTATLYRVSGNEKYRALSARVKSIK